MNQQSLNDPSKLLREDEIPERFVPSNGEMIDHFKVEKSLGEGSFGSVYKVTDNRTGKVHALKLLKLWEVLKDERTPIVQRFSGEYRCGLIDSQFLVKSTDFGKIKGNPYIIMDYCSNGDLRNLVGKSLSQNSINKYAFEILSGLQSLHKEGIVHRDLKPENVLLDHSNTAHLTDFGIAGFTNARMTKKNIFGHAMGIFGTYAYMPPEQLNPKISFKTMSPATDIFSFGAMFYELFTGKLPFGKLETESDIAQYVMRANKGEWDNVYTYRKDISPVWVSILEGCLEPKYEKRIQEVKSVIPMMGFSPAREEDMTVYSFEKDRLGLQIMKGEEHDRIYRISDMIKGNDGLLSVGWFDPEFPEKNNIGIIEAGSSYISNFHATIEKLSVRKKWYIRDGQWREKDGKPGWYTSTNGVYVNSQQCGAEGYEIKPGDIITIGDSTLKVIIL